MFQQGDFMACSRGQASFEMVLIATVVIVLTAAVLANFVPLKNDTLGVAAAKEATVAALTEQSKAYLVQRIDFSRSASNPKYNFRIFTFPVEVFSQPVDISGICANVSNATSWETSEIVIAFNSGTPSNCP